MNKIPKKQLQHARSGRWKHQPLAELNQTNDTYSSLKDTGNLHACTCDLGIRDLASTGADREGNEDYLQTKRKMGRKSITIERRDDNRTIDLNRTASRSGQSELLNDTLFLFSLFPELRKQTGLLATVPLLELNQNYS